MTTHQDLAGDPLLGLSDAASSPEAVGESNSSTLVAVARALLIYVDVYAPQLRWQGSVGPVDFVEALFPMVADIVQNGWYAPHQEHCPEPASIALETAGRAQSPAGNQRSQAAARAAARADEVAARAQRSKVRMAQADLGALSDLRSFTSTAKTTVASIRLGNGHMALIAAACAGPATPLRLKREMKTATKAAASSTPTDDVDTKEVETNDKQAEEGQGDQDVAAAGGDKFAGVTDSSTDEAVRERNALHDKQDYLVTELIRIMRGPVGSRRSPFFPTAEALRSYVEFLLSAVFAAADERNTQKLSWSAFESFLSDGAIVYSTQLGLEDITVYIQECSDDVGGLCIFGTGLSNGGMVIVVQTGTNLSLRYMMPVFNSSGNRMQFRTLSTSTLYVLCAAEVLESKRVLCGCSRHSAVFYDVSASSLPTIQSFSLEMLGDTPCCVRRCTVAGQELLVATGVAGTIWGFRPPAWSAPAHQWESGSIMWRRSPEEMLKETITQVIPSYTRKYFFVSTRADVHVIQLPSAEVRHRLPTAHDGMFHCRFIVYNEATRYLVAGGETSFLLVWLSPNLSDRRPVKLEDLVNPHSGVLAGLLTHSTDPVVVSLDMHGLMKFWSLARLACVQNIRVPNSMNSICGLMWLRNTRLVAATYSQLTCYKVDDETKEASVATLVRSPKGGSITACVQRDVVEWGTLDGKKLVHHQNLCEADISCVAYGGSSIIFVLMSNGSVACHASSSGKELAFYHRKVMRTEGVAMVFCSELRRAIVATVSSDVWFFSQTVSEPPFRQLLTGGDAACTTIAIGVFEKASKYFVGTHENTVQIFSLKPPNAVVFEHRIPPPSTDGLVGHVVALLFSNNCIFISDSVGWLRVHKGGKWQLVGAFDLEELDIAYAEKLMTSATGGDNTATAKPSSQQVGRALITKMEHYIENAVIVLGDSIGRVWIVDIGRPAAPVVVKMFDTHSPVKQLAIDGEYFFTADDAANLFIWSSDGALLGNLWGSHQTPPTRLPVLEKPSWYSECAHSIEDSNLRSLRSLGRMSTTFSKSISMFLEAAGKSAVHRRSVANKVDTFEESVGQRSLSQAVLAASSKQLQKSGMSHLQLSVSNFQKPANAASGGSDERLMTKNVFNRVSFCNETDDDWGGVKQNKATSSVAIGPPGTGNNDDGDDNLSIDSDRNDGSQNLLPLYGLPSIHRSESSFFDDANEKSVSTATLPISWRGSQQVSERLPKSLSSGGIGGSPCAAAIPGRSSSSSFGFRFLPPVVVPPGVVSLCWGYPSLKNRAAQVDPRRHVSVDLHQEPSRPAQWKPPTLKPVHKIRCVGGGTVVGRSATQVAEEQRSHSSLS
jgi:hypothetical protein